MFAPNILLYIAACTAMVCASQQGEEARLPPPSHTGLPVKPVNFGMVLFPRFQALDVFGPLDALNMVSGRFPMNLALLANTLDPVYTRPQGVPNNTYNSNFTEIVLPTHTFDAPPPNLDVLFIPGGIGTRASDLNINNTLAFIKRTAPTVKYVITVCTGAGLAARAGILDGRYATTNKAAWFETVKLGPRTTWIPHARWVVDNSTTVPPFVWSTSGISAGIDGTLAFVAHAFGEETANSISRGMEYRRQVDPSIDEFAEYYNLTEVVYPTIPAGTLLDI